MNLAKTECHCPHCGKLKLKRDGSPHKCVVVRFADNKDHKITFGAKTTLAELTAAGWKIELAPKDAPLPDGVFRSLSNTQGLT